MITWPIEVDSIFLKNKNPKAVLDIGSNDGTQLKHFKTLGYDILGVESSKRTALMVNFLYFSCPAYAIIVPP